MVWDPFEGELRIPAPNPGPQPFGFNVPTWLFSVTFVSILVSGYFIFATKDNDYNLDGVSPLALVGVLASTVVMGAMMILNNARSKARWRQEMAAKLLGWRFRAQPIWVSKTSTGKQKPIPPRVTAIQSAVPEFVEYGGDLLTALFDGNEFWGRTRENIPFWMLLWQSPALFAPRDKLEAGSVGGGQAVGNTIYTAFRLDRRTGVRIVLLPEDLTTVGTIDEDLESDAFNRRFRVHRDRGDAADLRRFLTPVVQESFVALFDAYGVRVMLEDDVLFMAGHTNRYVAKDPHVAARELAKLVSEFAEAATALKRYID
ncbi:hypothetical protein ABRA89_19850 [Fulvimarina sp. MAC8]